MDCSETSGIAGLHPGQPLSQRNRPESLTIKRNRGKRLSRSRTRPTRKTTKSSPIQKRFGSKVASQRGTRSSYMTPTKELQEIVLKTPPTKNSENHHKEGREKHFTTLRNNAELSIHTMKVRTRSSLPPKHPSLSLDLT
jgi:hypothetical protein